MTSLRILFSGKKFIALFEEVEIIIQPFSKQQILDNSNLKEFADDNFKFDENGGKLS